MQKLSEIKIGADIELFFQHLSTGEFVSAEGYVQGTKRRPFNFDKRDKYFICSLDNVCAEIGIPPVQTPEQWEEYLMTGVNFINSIAPKETCSVAVPAAIFNPEYLQTENAQAFGCESDYCVWTRSRNEKPSATNYQLRSAGGHIHVGHNLAGDRKSVV